jgi:hypothetical protein
MNVVCSAGAQSLIHDAILQDGASDRCRLVPDSFETQRARSGETAEYQNGVEASIKSGPSLDPSSQSIAILMRPVAQRAARIPMTIMILLYMAA